MAQFAIFLYTPAPGPSEPAPEYDDHSDDLARSGAMVAAFALEPTDTATSLRADTVTDGPFIETKEVIAGFYVIEAPDLGAALDMARRNPILKHGGGLELRSVAGGLVVPK